jgi:hypothetical protein
VDCSIEFFCTHANELYDALLQHRKGFGFLGRAPPVRASCVFLQARSSNQLPISDFFRTKLSADLIEAGLIHR